MSDENAAVLEFATILGEAIARAHMAGKDGKGVPRRSVMASRSERQGDATQHAANVVGENNG